MTSRNPSEPFDEVAHLGGAAAGARMVQDPSTTLPVTTGETLIVEHTHAADRALAPAITAPGESFSHRMSRWIGAVSARFETARQYLRRNDAKSIQADAMTFARRYPVQTLAGTLLAGMVVGRVLKRK